MIFRVKCTTMRTRVASSSMPSESAVSKEALEDEDFVSVVRILLPERGHVLLNAGKGTFDYMLKFMTLLVLCINL